MLKSALGATLLMLALAAPAAAQDSGGGLGGGTDAVTGYRCIDKSCTVLRLPNADCLCQKQNVLETKVSRLRLKCSTKEGGRWVACPVKSRYGISVD